MHPEAYRGVHWAIKSSGFSEYLVQMGDSRITALDLGGADINGTARRPVTEAALQLSMSVAWTAWDIEPGPGIDLVQDATLAPPQDQRGRFDVVLCTEVLEHVAAWDRVLTTALTVLRPGGHLFLTCAGRGRRPHGARGEMDPAPGEYYGNVHVAELDVVLGTLKFNDYLVQYNANPGDVYAWAVK